ncbi:MAG TPA: acyltransferase [Acidimicrobiia bacterium]|nr:acyltransferase [Acidimicrobiia bacterium]
MQTAGRSASRTVARLPIETQTVKAPPIPPQTLPSPLPTDRWPALDGLRGLAILLVFAFHLPLTVFRSGSYGVIVFFVLSGFLITTLLLKELDREDRPQLRWFYGRRAVRLFPALLLVVVGYLILHVTVFGQPERWWGQSWPALFYVSNYVLEGGGDLLHLTHTWSLAIEEHFYLVWPPALIAIPARHRLAAAWSIALALAAWRLGLLAFGGDIRRIYYLTDTNAFAPLLGCALAISHHQGRLRAIGRTASGLSVAALLALSMLPWDSSDRRLLYLAVPVALLAVVTIWSALETPAAWLESWPLRWFGTISYGLYLWHAVLIPLPWHRLGIDPMLPMVIAPIAIASASFYFLEAPLLTKWRRYERARLQAGSAAPAQSSRRNDLEPVATD